MITEEKISLNSKLKTKLTTSFRIKIESIEYYRYLRKYYRLEIVRTKRMSLDRKNFTTNLYER